MKTPIAATGLLLSLCLMTWVPAARAEELRIGTLEGNDGLFLTTSARTVIDWSHPANLSGEVNTATVRWANTTTPCDASFYVGFYYLASNAFSGVKTAERGPFRAVDGINTVTLDPPVTVDTDTYIGIRRTDGSASCGQVYGTFTRTPGRVLYSESDFPGGSFSTLNPLYDFTMQAQASGNPSVRVSTLPVVGSVAGGFGSFFRTSLTLSNPSIETIRGKVVLHPAGRAGTAADPSLAYEIPPNGTLNYADIIAAMGQSGLGSLDIYTTASPTPIVSSRVFNDTGASGTSGFSQEAVPAGAPYLSRAVVFVPTDLANFRLNIGVRTISACNLNVKILDANGQQQGGVLVKSYPADFFEQVAASAFLDGATLPPGGRIVIQAYQQDFIAYGAVTDNRTNDPSIRIGLD